MMPQYAPGLILGYKKKKKFLCFAKAYVDTDSAVGFFFLCENL